jgi:hypothetical protein
MVRWHNNFLGLWVAYLFWVRGGVFNGHFMGKGGVHFVGNGSEK